MHERAHVILIGCTTAGSFALIMLLCEVTNN